MGDFAPEFKLGTPLSVILRAFDVVDKYIFDRKRHIADVLVTPDMGDLNALDFSPAGKARAVAAGRSAMLAHIGEVEQVLAHGVKAH